MRAIASRDSPSLEHAPTYRLAQNRLRKVVRQHDSLNDLAG